MVQYTTLLPSYVNWSTNFRALPHKVEMVSSCLKYINTHCCWSEAMQQRFGLGMWICERNKIIYVVCIYHRSCGILSASCLFSIVVTVSSRRPKASSICSIFSLGMESNPKKKSTNNTITSRFFARISMIWQIDWILDVDRLFRKLF